MDIKSYTRWDDYTKARDEMFAASDTAWEPWYIARSEDKQRVRLNIISPPALADTLQVVATREGETAEAQGALAAAGRVGQGRPREVLMAPDVAYSDGKTNMRIGIGNTAPDTTDDELKAFVKKYAPELECTEVQRVEDGGTRPGAILQFTGTTAQLGNLAVRLHAMYRKGHSLSCHTLLGVP